MKIKAVRGAHGDYGSVRRGQIVDIADGKAQQLVKRGLFVPVQAGDKEAAKKAGANPSSRRGGQTGGAKPLLSSPAARAPKPLTSTKSKDDAE
ncbi:hypothetical protein [Mesorhizobium muleiense]|uniref:hypothetical protein n=1 Tax=Mesorhizobium muleiense TaxID=1004279 RepID=UPI001F3750BC|nr:hypothetical protein [Mesorhizobium muleiense]MCF6111991.1 hypothetical protein [Mesorhizobium muleiense]